VESIVLAVVLGGCAAEEEPTTKSTAPCPDAAVSGSPFGVQCGQLVDEHGRVAFLRGVNGRVEGIFDVTFEDGRTALEPIPSFSSADAQAMRDFGFDALRLPINWSGLEPTEDGGFDEDYMSRVEAVVDTAAAADLVVLIDFHQDAYSKEIGEDGAPLWAILPPPTQLLEGPLTAEELEKRRFSPQVLAAFETFFGATPDGAWLRQRLTSAAAFVAERFATHPAVVGIEIFNEPQATDAGIARLNELAHPVLRKAAPDKLYVFEPPVTRNILDSAPVPDEPLGEMVGYAPHVYTLAFTGTDEQYQAMSKETLRRSHENARVEADAWKAPLLITEWGFNPAATKASEYLTWQAELGEEYQSSSFYWVWKEQSQGSWGCFDFDATTNIWSERPAVKKALARVRPRRVAGWPKRFGFDRQTGVFELTFRSNPLATADHEIAVAPLLGQPQAALCDGTSTSFDAAESGVVVIRCGRGDDREHVLRVEVAPLP